MNISRLNLPFQTRAERKMGRLMRGPEDHPGAPAGFDSSAPGADSQATGDNQSGNSGDSQGTGEGQDNNGQTPDYSSFWNNPAPDANSQTSQSGNESGQPADPTQELGQQISEGIQGYSPPEVFTQEIGNQIAEGNLQGVNDMMTQYGRNVTQHAVVQSVKVMQALSEKLMNDFNTKLDERLGGEKNQQTLLTEFPSMNTPEMRPVIEGIFTQSMKHSNNDRTKAVEMTRGMLRIMGQKGAKDFGVPVPDRSQGNINHDASQSLVDELLGRGG